jgi:hypothetical protein
LGLRQKEKVEVITKANSLRMLDMVAIINAKNPSKDWKIPTTPLEYRPYLVDDYLKIWGLVTGKDIHTQHIDISTKTIINMNKYICNKNSEEYKLYVQLEGLITKAKNSRVKEERKSLDAMISKVQSKIDDAEKLKFKADCIKKAEFENITIHRSNASDKEVKNALKNRKEYLRMYVEVEDLHMIQKTIKFLVEKFVQGINTDVEFNQMMDDIDKTIKQYQPLIELKSNSK